MKATDKKVAFSLPHSHSFLQGYLAFILIFPYLWQNSQSTGKTNIHSILISIDKLVYLSFEGQRNCYQFIQLLPYELPQNYSKALPAWIWYKKWELFMTIVKTLKY